jgi:hypothetical protein
MSDKTGGSAFPRDAALESKGMTLRDYFAGQAMAFVSASLSPDRFAEQCYKIADAMIAAREK